MQFIYVVGSACGKLIKIGWSETHEGLRKRLQEHAKNGLRGILFPQVICYMQGTQQQERQIQLLLSASAVEGEKEIFFATSAVMGWAVWSRIQWHSRHDAFGLEVPDLEEFEKWKPTPNRIEEATKESETPLFDSEKDAWFWLPNNQRFPNEDYVAPVNYIEAVRAAFDGTIDIDPASHSFAQRYIKAKRYFNESMNGLKQPWRGKVWLNPPFSDCDRWFSKAMEELHTGRTTELIGLVDFDKINSNYFQKFLPNVTLMYLIAGRVAWTDRPQTKTEDPVPRHGYIFLYYGNSPERFRRAMRQHVAGTFWRVDTAEEVLMHV